MKKSEVLKLIKRGEDENTECKPSLSQINEIVETVSAFANVKGGKIIVGISSSGKILGINIGKDTLEKLTNKIAHNTDPKVHPSISVEKVEGKKIIVIEVKPSLDKLTLAFGRPYKRVGDSTRKMSKDEYERFILEKHKEKLYFDSQVCEDANLKDINESKMRWFINEARKHRDLKIPYNAKPKDILRQVGLLQDGKLTNAALLLFAKEPKFIQSEVKCIRFKGNKPVKPYIDFQTLEGNIFDLVDRALDFVLRNIKKAIWLIPGQVQREEKYEYPPDAIREAIVNAVVHRNYFSPSKVQVRVFDDYMEIWNPGELPKGWTVEKLTRKHESIPRNPLLFKQFFWVKYVEDVGGGTLDIIRECKEWGLAEPDFEYTGTSLVIILRKSKLTEEYLTSLGLNERQKKAIEFLRENKKINTKKYMQINKVSDKTAFLELKNLLNKDILIREGRGRAVVYRIKGSDKVVIR